ncbi:MAG: caspase family protein [Bacteroidota bacterium]
MKKAIYCILSILLVVSSIHGQGTTQQHVPLPTFFGNQGVNSILVLDSSKILLIDGELQPQIYDYKYNYTIPLNKPSRLSAFNVLWKFKDDVGNIFLIWKKKNEDSYIIQRVSKETYQSIFSTELSFKMHWDRPYSINDHYLLLSGYDKSFVVSLDSLRLIEKIDKSLGIDFQFVNNTNTNEKYTLIGTSEKRNSVILYNGKTIKTKQIPKLTSKDSVFIIITHNKSPFSLIIPTNSKTYYKLDHRDFDKLIQDPNKYEYSSRIRTKNVIGKDGSHFQLILDRDSKKLYVFDDRLNLLHRFDFKDNYSFNSFENGLLIEENSFKNENSFKYIKLNEKNANKISIKLPGAGNIQDIDFNESGNLLITEEGNQKVSIFNFEATKNSNEWKKIGEISDNQLLYKDVLFCSSNRTLYLLLAKKNQPTFYELRSWNLETNSSYILNDSMNFKKKPNLFAVNDPLISIVISDSIDNYYVNTIHPFQVKDFKPTYFFEKLPKQQSFVYNNETVKFILDSTHLEFRIPNVSASLRRIDYSFGGNANYMLYKEDGMFESSVSIKDKVFFKDTSGNVLNLNQLKDKFEKYMLFTSWINEKDELKTKVSVLDHLDSMKSSGNNLIFEENVNIIKIDKNTLTIKVNAKPEDWDSLSLFVNNRLVIPQVKKQSDIDRNGNITYTQLDTLFDVNSNSSIRFELNLKKHISHTSRGTQITIPSPKEEENISKKRFFGLFVAVPETKQPFSTLPNTSNDVKVVSEMLTIALKNNKSYEIDSSVFRIWDTKKNICYTDAKIIQRWFDSIQPFVRPQDDVFLFFAGHGSTANSDTVKFILDGKDSFNPTDIGRWFEHINTSNRIFVFDACRSGNITNYLNFIEGHNQKKGLTVYAAVKGDKNALDIDEDFFRNNSYTPKHGVTSYHLLTTINHFLNYSTNKNAFSFNEWFEMSKRFTELFYSNQFYKWYDSTTYGTIPILFQQSESSTFINKSDWPTNDQVAQKITEILPPLITQIGTLSCVSLASNPSKTELIERIMKELSSFDALFNGYRDVVLNPDVRYAYNLNFIIHEKEKNKVVITYRIYPGVTSNSTDLIEGQLNLNDKLKKEQIADEILKKIRNKNNIIVLPSGTKN